jgi:hypothetical protein
MNLHLSFPFGLNAIDPYQNSPGEAIRRKEIIHIHRANLGDKRRHKFCNLTGADPLPE